MPARWFVPIDSLDPTKVRSHHLHAAISRWFDRDAHSHCAGEKPYAVSPVADDTCEEVGRVGVEVATLTEGAQTLLLRASRPGAQIRVGSQTRALGPARLMHQADWNELLACPPAERWKLQFATPVTFRSGNRSTPLPHLGTVLGGLARVWRQWSPVTPEDLPDATRAAWISDLDLRSVVVKVPVPGKDGTVQELVTSGSLGSVTVRCDPPHLRSTVGALLSLAAYCGVGSMTLRGLGVTRVEAHRARSRPSPTEPGGHGAAC